MKDFTLERFGANRHVLSTPFGLFFFSYSTCIAYNYRTTQIRIESPSATTSKHMTEFRVKDNKVVSNEDFNAIIAKAIKEYYNNG